MKIWALHGKLGGENRARQRNVNSMEEKIALLSTHISFFARSLMAKPCNLLPLWTCIPPRFRDEPKFAPQTSNSVESGNILNVNFRTKCWLCRLSSFPKSAEPIDFIRKDNQAKPAPALPSRPPKPLHNIHHAAQQKATQRNRRQRQAVHSGRVALLQVREPNIAH